MLAKPNSREVLFLLILHGLWWIIVVEAVDQSLLDQGCADGTREGLLKYKRIAACSGTWPGHIVNADHLCAPGWMVCSHEDGRLLKEITWADATEFGGCYAFNAAQDGGTCHECGHHLEKDDLAAVGRGCAHQNFGQSSCISGGKIAASCCVDTHFNKACVYQAGLMTGVLCCRRRNDGRGAAFSTRTTATPSVTPLFRPAQRVEAPWVPTKLNQMSLIVSHSNSFFVRCPASNPRTARVTWFKGTRVLPGKSNRMSILTSGDLFIVRSKIRDAGLYTCSYKTAEGRTISVKTDVYVEGKAVCHPPCSNRSRCVTSGFCKCRKGYIGKTCNIRLRHYRCKMPCYNGGRCHRGRCLCPKHYWGVSCHRTR